MFSENILQNIVDFFNGNSLLNFISLMLGLLGVIFSFVFYLKSIRKKIPVYTIRTINIISPIKRNINNLNILFKNEEISHLSISKLALWNHGKETINNFDIANINPVKIIINDDNIFLESQIIYQKNHANNFKLVPSTNKKSILIEFDYFDQYEGVIIQIFHTAKSSKEIVIEGNIKSVNKILRKDINKNIFNNPVFNKIIEYIGKRNISLISNYFIIYISLLFTFTGISMLLSGEYTSTNNSSLNNSTDKNSIIVLILIFVVMGILPAIKVYHYTKKNIPTGFDIFNEEFLKNTPN